MSQALFTHQATLFQNLPFNAEGIFEVKKGDVILRFVRLTGVKKFLSTEKFYILMVLEGEIGVGADQKLNRFKMCVGEGKIEIIGVSEISIVCIALGTSLQSVNAVKELSSGVLDILNLPFETKSGVSEKKYYTLQLGNQVFKWILFDQGHVIKKHIHTDIGMLKLQFTGEIQYDHEQITYGGEFLTFVSNLEHYEGKILQESIILTIETVGGQLKELS